MIQVQPSARDERVKELSHMSKAALAAMCRAGVRRPDGGRIIIEGTCPVVMWDKHEIISAILSVEFPSAVAG